MSGDDRVLSRLYRQLAQSERHLDQVSTNARDSEDSEERSMFFEQMIETKSGLVSDMALSSAYTSYVHDTVKSVINGF